MTGQHEYRVRVLCARVLLLPAAPAATLHPTAAVATKIADAAAACTYFNDDDCFVPESLEEARCRRRSSYLSRSVFNI